MADQTAAFLNAAGVGSNAYGNTFDLVFNDVADHDAAWYGDNSHWWDRTNVSVPNFARWVTYMTRLHADMTIHVEELKQREAEIRKINGLYEVLQTCDSELEAYPIIGSVAAQLFPGASGALAVSVSRLRRRPPRSILRVRSTAGRGLMRFFDSTAEWLTARSGP